MDGVGVEPNHTTAESLALYKSISTLSGTDGHQERIKSGKFRDRFLTYSSRSFYFSVFIYKLVCLLRDGNLTCLTTLLHDLVICLTVVLTTSMGLKHALNSSRRKEGGRLEEPCSSWIKYGVSSSKFIWAPCAQPQLYSLAETPQSTPCPPPPPQVTLYVSQEDDISLRPSAVVPLINIPF